MQIAALWYCSTPAIVCGKRSLHRSHASLLPRCCLGSSSPALVCDSSPPAAKESNPCRLCGPVAAPVRASRRERTSCNSAAPSRESSERDATGTTGIRRRRVLRHLQLRGLGPEAHARVEHVHAQVSRRVGRSVGRASWTRETALRRRAMSARVRTIHVSADRS